MAIMFENLRLSKNIDVSISLIKVSFCSKWPAKSLLFILLLA